MKEKQLLYLLFKVLDKIEFKDPQLCNDTLKQISSMYGIDINLIVSCYINCNWAYIDNVDPMDVIKEYIG